MWHIFLLHVGQISSTGIFVLRTHLSPNVVSSVFPTGLFPFKIAGIAVLPVVKNKAMTELYSLAKRICRSNTPVLITGEAGVGKEVVARYIHDQSGSERGGEFVAVNCRSVQENLMDSELFGYMKGAFTDADKDKAGLVEVADGGTLFIDEVEEINHAMQVKLLRVIEEKEHRRLGSSDTTKSNFRLICATNRDLRSMIDQDKFREDLYHRITGAIVKVPALRERLDEIPLFVDYFIREVQPRRESCFGEAYGCCE